MYKWLPKTNRIKIFRVVNPENAKKKKEKKKNFLQIVPMYIGQEPLLC
jgi:hypothetical protein